MGAVHRSCTEADLQPHYSQVWKSGQRPWERVIVAQEDLDALLTRMDAIAKAVNSFKSETVQHEAFSALVAAFEGKRHGTRPAAAPTQEPEHEPGGDASVSEPATGKPGSGNAKTKRATKDARAEWRMVKELDLRPPGKQSLEDFIEEKKPSSNEDKYAAVVYYLSEILEVPAVTIHQVGTVFRLTKSWKEPTDLASGLRTASSRKGTVDTKSYDDIKLTPTGRNFIDHELPPKEKAKK
jgi:hypothetical protein